MPEPVPPKGEQPPAGTPARPLGVQLRWPDGRARDVDVTLDGWRDGSWCWVADVTDEEGREVRTGAATLHVARFPAHTALGFPLPGAAS